MAPPPPPPPPAHSALASPLRLSSITDDSPRQIFWVLGFLYGGLFKERRIFESSRKESFFFLNLGHSRLPSSLQKISQWDTTHVNESFTPTHPGTRILSLMTHQDVKYVSFLQRKYGRYKDPVVAFVVVFGSFPSCSTVCRDPGGDQCTTRGLHIEEIALSY